MVQTWIAALLVGLAALYCLWYLLPASARKRLGFVHRLLARAPSCGSCSDCGKCASSADSASNRSVAGPRPLNFHRKP